MLFRSMKASWEAFAGACYILGHQYLESDQAPYTIDKAFEIMTVIHSRDDWEKGASKRVAVTEENMKNIFAEKKKAIVQTKELYAILDIDRLGAPAAFAEDMKAVIRTMVLFAEFCDVTTRAMYLTVWAEQTKDEQDAKKAGATVTELLNMADSLERELEGTDYPYYLYSRLHPRRIRRFAADVERRVKALAT